jgi:hypothetical protein
MFMHWRRPSAWIPIAMSVAALTTIAVHIAIAGTAPQPDEGTAAHIWQLLMAGQLPIVMFNGIKWLPVSTRPTLQILGVQAAAGLAAMAPVYALGW